MVHTEYVIVFHDWYTTEWWTQTITNYGIHLIQGMLNCALLFDHYPKTPQDIKNVTNVRKLICEKCIIMTDGKS